MVRAAKVERALKVLDLFSGIGGFSLGLERAGMKTDAFCEIEEYPRRVLAKHWPDVPIYEDVRTLTRERLESDGITGIDVICGGFPCQDISDAGKRAGIGGKRSGLWREFARLIGELRPRFAIVENVSALRSRGLGQVLGDLAALGYDTEWHCIPASYVGAPHPRDRIWLVAYPDGEYKYHLLHTSGLQRSAAASSTRQVDPSNSSCGISRPFGWIPESGLDRVVDGVPHRVDRVIATGNAVVPQIPEIIGRVIMEAA